MSRNKVEMKERDPKGYVINRDLELTPMAEIRRLQKVIEEKNSLIAEFKNYDKKRIEYYQRFEQNYTLMEEQFNNFIECVREEEGWGTAQMVKEALTGGMERERKFQAKKERAERCVQEMNEIVQSFDKIEKGLQSLLTYVDTYLSNIDRQVSEKVGSLLLNFMKLSARVNEAKDKY